MAITEADIKLLASERLNDDLDGGGYMTGTTVQDGVENNLFPDVSSLDRAQGAMDFRKVFAGVLTDNVDTYFGAHAVIDVVPADPAVAAVMVESASVSEVKSGLVTRLNTILRGIGPYYGTLALATSRASGDLTVYTAGIAAPLIPKIKVAGTPSTKPLAETGNTGSNQLALVAVGSPITASAWPNGLPVLPGSLSGTGTVSGFACNLVENQVDGTIEFRKVSDSTLVFTSALPFGYFNFQYASITALSVTYIRALPVWLPRETIEIAITSANRRAVYTQSVPAGTVPGSETVVCTSGAVAHYLRSRGATRMQVAYSELGSPGGATDTPPSGSVDRSGGSISVSLDTFLPDPGTVLRYGYVRGGFATSLAFSAVGSSGVVSGAGLLTVTPSSGWRVADVDFVVSATRLHSIENGNIVTDAGVVKGFLDRSAGTITLIGYNGLTISQWFAVEASNGVTGGSLSTNIGSALDPVGIVVAGTTQAGAAFTATSDANGAFSTAVVTGQYAQAEGLIVLAFLTPVKLATLTYTATPVTYAMPAIDTPTLDPAQFPDSGKVPVIRQGGVVVVSNTITIAPQTVTNSQDINLGRTRVADVRVIGNNGVEIITGFTVNKVTGHIVFSAVGGYSQPVTITHRVEDMATVVRVLPTGEITLSRPLSHTFPSATSFISSALVVGDLHARVHAAFAQSTWLGNWLDALDPGSSTPIASYNSALAPPEITNKGGIKERWAIIFTTSTSFRVVGEQVGQIITNGSTAFDCVPNNPATAVPYFTLRATGWGSGWSAGNVLRFNTDGATAPFWIVRSIVPSDPFVGQDKITVAVRGDIDA